MEWDGITLEKIVKTELYRIFFNLIPEASKMNNTEYAALLKKKYNHSGNGSSNRGAYVNCTTDGIEIRFSCYDKVALKELKGENRIKLSWSMAARHIRAWELEKEQVILFNQYKEEFGKFCRFDKVMGSDSIYAKQHWDKAQKIYDKIVSQGLEPTYKKWREMNRKNLEQQKTICDSCINKDENCLIPSNDECIGYTSLNDKVLSIANDKKEDKMTKKRSFDAAIIKDIKSVAGDSFADNIKMLPVDQLHDNPENFYDLSDLDTLVEDIDRQGLKTPLYVVPDDDGYMVISGHRRKAAVQELIDGGKYGTDKLPCYIGVKKNEAEAMLDLIMLNATTRVISDAETVKQCEKLEEVFKKLEADGKKVQGRMRDKIAAALNVSPAQVGKVENIRHNAIDEVKAAVNEGKMSISTANEVAKLEPKKQKDLIEKKKPEEITHKEIKNTVATAKEKVSPQKDVPIEEINQIPNADLDYEDGFEDMTLDDYKDNSASEDNAVVMPTADEDAEMREKATTAAKAMAELWVKPPEYFNDIVNSGMCNSIISGYVLLVLEELQVDCPKNILHIINGIFDTCGAQTARDKFSNT